MNLLAIETSCRPSSVAVLSNGILAARMTWESPDPGKDLFDAIDAVLERARIAPCDIDFFVPSLGPGSWTGIRIGMGAAVGMAEADMLKIFAVGSLDGMGHHLRGAGKTAAVLRATAGKYHSAIFLRPDDAATRPGDFATCDAEKTRVRLRGCSLLAGPDPDTLSALGGKTAMTIELAPCAAFNALLAAHRISLGMSSIFAPCYEK